MQNHWQRAEVCDQAPVYRYQVLQFTIGVKNRGKSAEGENEGDDAMDE